MKQHHKIVFSLLTCIFTVSTALSACAACNTPVFADGESTPFSRSCRFGESTRRNTFKYDGLAAVDREAQTDSGTGDVWWVYCPEIGGDVSIYFPALKALLPPD